MSFSSQFSQYLSFIHDRQGQNLQKYNYVSNDIFGYNRLFVFLHSSSEPTGSYPQSYMSNLQVVALIHR